MPPLSKKAISSLIRTNATRKGLLGGNRMWTAVFFVQTLAKLGRKLGKGKEMSIDFTDDMKQGGVFAIIHNPPPPTKKQQKKAKKSAAKLGKRSAKLDRKPSRRNRRKARRAEKKLDKRRGAISKRLVKPTIVEVGLDR